MSRNSRRRSLLSSVTCVAALGAALAVSLADDPEPKPLELNLVPKAVMNAVMKKYPDAQPQSAVQGVEDKKPFIDVHILVKGQKIWVTCDPGGAIQMIDREITVKELPAAVAAAFNKKYPQATVRLVNEIAEGSEASYDIAITFQKKPIIAVFAASGAFLEELPDQE
jgi:hypothetical protein